MFLNNIVSAEPLIKDTIIYKIIEGNELRLYVTSPTNNNKKYPCLLFFYGGGWKSKNINQFEPFCEYFSKRGYVCIRAEYRVEIDDNATPFESLSDARSSIRYIRKHAEELNIDTAKIAVGGGSAGGHLAIACATAKIYDDKFDDLSVSCLPNALLLYNPVIDNGPSGYGFKRIGDEYKNFSPLHNLYKGIPPTTFFLGEKDKLIPIETAKYFQTSMHRLGNRCDLYLFKGEGHGFFNSERYIYQILSLSEKFLESLKWN